MSRRGTIRRQLYTLLFVVVFPLLVLFLAFLLFAWKSATEHASQSTLALARLEAREIGDLIDDAQRLVDRLAERPLVRQARAGHCDPMLQEAFGLQRHVEFIAVADARGQIVCTTHPPVDGRLPNVSGNPLFHAMLSDSAPPPSEPFRSQITGHWISLVSRRLEWEGRVSGTVGVALDLVSMQDMFANGALPNGSTVTVVDGQGTIVSRVPEGAEWVGKSVRDVEVVSLALADGEGVVEADGLDGVRRIYAFTTVQGTKWRVYAGVPVAIAFSAVRNLTRIGVATILIALVVALFFALLVVRGLVTPIRRLEEEIDALPNKDDRIDLPEDSPTEMVRVVEAMNDLLARRAEAERAVAEHGKLLEGILDGASDLITVRDLEGRIVHTNQATLDWLGMKREDVIGRLASDLADDPGAQRLDEAARQVAETGESSISEDALFDSRKEEVFITTRTPLRDDAGKIVGVIIASKDVSELRQGERERTRLAGEVRRREAVSALGALVGSVAHEVRNPLFAISSTLDAVVARFRGQPELAPFLEVLKRETVRLNAIMNELLEYGRARAEELRPDRVEPAVEAAVELCRPQAIARRVHLDLRMTSGLPAVSMDRDRLVMAMRNVVDNAIRHAPAGSTVSVRVGLQPENGGGVEFQVRDRGPGFSPEVLQRLFEPFITQRPGGIGLGLYLVKRVVEDHGGRVSVENALDGGGLVRLWIPHDGAQAGGPRDAVA